MSKSKNNVIKEAEETEKQSLEEFSATVPFMASVMNASLLEPFAKPVTSEMDFNCLVEALDKNIEEIKNGNMSSMEAMLIAQAQSLQSIFVSLGLKASSQTNINHYTTFMTLALKTQSQVRSTILALAELKYPKQVAFVKQANIAHGNQQVNNGDLSHSSCARACAEENQNQQNELLDGDRNGSTQMDRRATQTTIHKDKAMATLEK